MTTDKQKFRLKKAGYTDEQIDKMDWKQVSDIIGKLPAYHKEVIEPNTEQIVSSGFSGDLNLLRVFGERVLFFKLGGKEKENQEEN